MQTYDGLNLLSKLTPRRARNAARVLFSYHRSRRAGQARMVGLPISLSLEPTTACNLRCPECPSGLRSFTRPTGRLSVEMSRDIIDQLHETLLYLTFYFQGEPYLHPQFLELVRYAADRRIYTATSTNGHFLHDDAARKTVISGLDRLVISIDGTTQDVYEQYRVGGKLEKVLAGTQNVVNWKRRLRSRTPHVVFQFLVVAPNEHQLADVRALAGRLGVDEVAYKTAQIYDFQHGSPLLPRNPRYARYRRLSDGTYGIKNALDDRCWKMWHSCVVTWNGTVVPCCFDKDAQHPMGSLTDRPFADLWFSDTYQRFRQQLLLSRAQIDMCRNCTEGTRVHL